MNQDNQTVLTHDILLEYMGNTYFAQYGHNSKWTNSVYSLSNTYCQVLIEDQNGHITLTVILLPNEQITGNRSMA